MTGRLPWEVVETLPSSDPELVEEWERRAAGASEPAERARALVGRALARYWAVQEGVVDEAWDDVARQRADDVAEALAIAREVGAPDLLAEALLGHLYALWGPDHLAGRDGLVAGLVELAPDVADEELRLRILEWVVLARLDAGDLDGARTEIARFDAESAGTALVLFRRRSELWRANVAMLEGRIDEAVAINQAAIASTAGEAGAPFSFQNVAITIAIERYLRRGLGEVIETVRSIRASSPRVGANWDTGLAFSLAEVGDLDEAGELFDVVAADDFAAVPRDLNWLVTMQLLGLIALRLDDRPRISRLLELLRPFADRDATHGSGYASYGPVGRVVGSLAARCGHLDEALECFDAVLASRPPGPWTSLTRLDRAVALEQLDPEESIAGAERAARELLDLGLDRWAGEARTLVDRLELGGHGRPIAVRGGGHWTLRHPEGVATVPDATGMRRLTRLLASPGQAIDVTVLDGPGTSVGEEGGSGDDRTAALAEPAGDSTLDAEARRSYRRRLAELDGLGRPRSAAEETERGFLLRELAGARHVRSGSAEVERARVRTTKALRRAIDAIAERSPALGIHLAEAVTTGRRCSYAPADGRAWRIVDRGRNGPTSSG